MAEVSPIETAFLRFRIWLRSLFMRRRPGVSEQDIQHSEALEDLLRKGQEKAAKEKPEAVSFRKLMKQCEDCGRKAEWMEGPSGGMSVNIFCGHCGAGYNVCPPLEFAERIGRNVRYIKKGESHGTRRR